MQGANKLLSIRGKFLSTASFDHPNEECSLKEPKYCDTTPIVRVID